MRTCGAPFTVKFPTLSDEYEYLDILFKAMLNHLLVSDLSELSSIRNGPRVYLRDIMAAKMQDSAVISMINEVFAQICTPIIRNMGTFTLRLMLSATNESITNGNFSTEAFKITQILKQNYEAMFFLGMTRLIEGFILLLAKHISDDDK